MPIKLSIPVGKQNDIDYLASQSPIFVAKTNSSSEFTSPCNVYVQNGQVSV